MQPGAIRWLPDSSWCEGGSLQNVSNTVSCLSVTHLSALLAFRTMSSINNESFGLPLWSKTEPQHCYGGMLEVRSSSLSSTARALLRSRQPSSTSSAYCSNTFHRSLRPTSSLAILTYASTVRAIRRRYVLLRCWMPLVQYSAWLVGPRTVAAHLMSSSPEQRTSHLQWTSSVLRVVRLTTSWWPAFSRRPG